MARITRKRPSNDRGCPSQAPALTPWTRIDSGRDAAYTSCQTFTLYHNHGRHRLVLPAPRKISGIHRCISRTCIGCFSSDLCIDKKTRDKAIKNLSTFLSVSGEDALPKNEVAKLWKGIFYCTCFISLRTRFRTSF